MFAPPPLRRTYEAAVRDLQSTRADVRASAARDLGLVGDAHPREAADALAPLIDDGDANVRSAALTSLGQLAARHLLDRIHPRFDDTDSRVRQMAVVAVAETGGERALTLLREGLKHTQADVRYQCLLGVLSINAREGFAVALDALTHDDPWIAAEAAEQIGRLIALDPTERTEVELDPSDRERALAALGAAATPAAPRAEILAEHFNPHVRAAAEDLRRALEPK
jgi:HEAT repeat protein